MGWFWSSTPSSRQSPSQARSTQLPSESLRTTSSTPTSETSPPPPPPPPPPATGDSILDNDPELRKFLEMFQGSGESEQGQQPPSPQAAVPTPKGPARSMLAKWRMGGASASPDEHYSSAADTTSSSSPASETYTPRERSLAEATLPTTMSCRQAFDLAWACQSPAGQWRAVYRHGSVRPCSDLWDDFWFCMRTRALPAGPAKEETIRAHYRKKELDKYYAPGQRSSEDVWRSRTVDEVLPQGAVFQHSFQVAIGGGGAGGEDTAAVAATAGDNNTNNGDDAGGRKDADQILSDLERRRRIRQQMGYNS